jgi:sialic acid synthase SpsE/sugar phosphate isomerase/epimerase
MGNQTLSELFANGPSKGRTYIIAEAGINHDGKLDKAKKLMRIAADSGADAVKFQKRDLSEIYPPDLLADSNMAEWSFQYILPQLSQVELSIADYYEISRYAEELALDLIVTPFDSKSAEFIATLNLRAIKIASSDMTNWGLIRKVSEFKLPVILSTGMWSDDQISETSVFLKELEIDFALLLCQSTYPAPIESVNLLYLKTLNQYAPVIGYSGHERGITVCLGAVGMGARIIEKHITIDHTESGPDHKASLEPRQFESLVSEIRILDKAIGANRKVISQAEILNRHVFAKSITASRNLNSGEVLVPEDVAIMAPGKGIPPCNLVEWIGKTLVRSKKKFEYLTEDDFQTAITIDQWDFRKFSRPWGIKCRFHDYSEYSILDTPVVEFHCTDKDIEGDFNSGNKNTDLIIHAPEIIDKDLVDLCSSNNQIANRSLKVLEQTIEKTINLSPKYNQATRPKIVIHVGGMLIDDCQGDSISMMRVAEKRLSRLDLSSIDLLPENLPPRPWYLGGQWYQHAFVRPKEMKQFCEDLGLGMTLDICHAQLYCAYAGERLFEYITTVMPVVKHLHISDAAGIDAEGLQINDGEINFDEVFKLLEKTKYSWVPEVWSGHINHGLGCHVALQRLQDYRFFL